MEIAPPILPGITFTVAAPPPSEVLPRMDIAAFVGMAACGPLHRPVVVEDAGAFRAIFGPDLALARDPERNETAVGLLGPAVEAFFRNGGRRCWVVRVADAAVAVTHRFAVPGLYPQDPPALARARCPGSWAAGLRTGAVLHGLGLRPLAFTAAGRPGAPDAVDRLVVQVQEPPGAVLVGDLLRLVFEDGTLLLAAIDAVARTEGRLHLSAASQVFWLQAPPGTAPEAVSDLGPDTLTTIHPTRTEVEALTLRTAERLRFDLLVWDGQALQTRLADLAFDPRHPRAWTRLPDDLALYPRPGRRTDDALDPLAREAARPRFPLAGPASPPPCYLPLGMATRPDPDRTEAAFGPARFLPPLQQNGLARFDAALFLDPDLAPLGTRTLATAAFDRLYVQERPLSGLHSLFPVDEVTLLAVPDAVQRGWDPAEVVLPGVLDAPTLTPIPPPDARGVYTLTWSPVFAPEPPHAPVPTYRVEEAAEPTFAEPTVRYEGADTQVGLPVPLDGAQTLFYRVRAEQDGRVGPWSNTEATVVPPRAFDPCRRVPAPLPLVRLADAPPDSPPAAEAGLRLAWPDVPGVDRFVLQQARDPGFLTAIPVDPDRFERLVVDGTSLVSVRAAPSTMAVYYRVRAEQDGRPGPWSNTVAVYEATARVQVVERPAAYRSRPLLDVQRALLRFCAARGDVLAVLALPSHYRREDALAHRGLLTPAAEDDRVAEPPPAESGPRVLPLSPDEARALSYGALYHPWLYTRRAASGEVAPGQAAPGEPAPAFRLVPPDGAATGMMAAQALQHGAWVAPAHRVLHGPTALAPALDRDDWAAAYRAGINLVRQEPPGFLTMSALTLSPEADLQPINVRRLLILLRRLVLREGPTYVFETNDPATRRRLYYLFDALLADLYRRGALAGAAPAEAYRIVTDETINPPPSVDQGRLLVELRVAPSRPLAFLTVRLVQHGPEGFRLEES